MNYFTFEELIHSDTAQHQKINNIPEDWDVIESLSKLKDLLNTIRAAYGKPITVNSGYRCPKLNQYVGGVANSQHLHGQAADITSQDNKQLWSVIIQLIDEHKIDVGQMIDESHLKWIHISIPDEKHHNQILSI